MVICFLDNQANPSTTLRSRKHTSSLSSVESDCFEEWRPLLLIVPLRLGLTTINRCYLPAIQVIFAVVCLSWCVLLISVCIAFFLTSVIIFRNFLNYHTVLELLEGVRIMLFISSVLLVIEFVPFFYLGIFYVMKFF